MVKTVDEFYPVDMMQVVKLLNEGKEQEAADTIASMCNTSNTSKWRSANVLACLYGKFTDPAILYRCIIDTYIHDGYNFPKRVILCAKKIAPSISPEERYEDLPDGDVLTVYRAANTPINKVHNDISWTINKNVALWFAYRYCYMFDGLFLNSCKPLHVYH